MPQGALGGHEWLSLQVLKDQLPLEKLSQLDLLEKNQSPTEKSSMKGLNKIRNDQV